MEYHSHIATKVGYTMIRVRHECFVEGSNLLTDVNAGDLWYLVVQHQSIEMIGCK